MTFPAVLPTIDATDFALHTRPCPVCASAAVQLLMAQRFTVPSRGGVHGGYDVVLCKRCGFAFAGSTPSQQFFEWYYDSLARKDEMLDPARGFMENKETIVRNSQTADFLAPNLAKGARVLDIGCYTGYLLRQLAARVPGLILTGLDPSQFAADVAQRFHGLDVRVGNVFGAQDLGEYDCVIASHVVEHLVEVQPFLQSVRQLLTPGGIFFIEVPDAAGFSADPQTSGSRAEPYFEYNFEHINYFTQTSLRNLLVMNGFEVVRLEARVSTLPVLAAVCRAHNLPFAAESVAALQRYNEESARRHAKVAIRISAALAAHAQIAVWGAGAHTQRLLASGVLPAERVEFFIDANPALSEALLGGRPVHSPEALETAAPMAVLISSFRSETQIAARLHSEYPQHTALVLYA
jgi:SAM-dependent methyltransferase